MLNLILSYRWSKIKVIVVTHVQIRSVHIQSQFKLTCTNQSIFMSKIACFLSADAHLGCDSSIPLAAQELMKKMVRQFALEYASKCLLNTSANGVTTRTSSPLSETADAPLDLTVSRSQEKEDTQSEPGGKTIWHIAN